ncbi:MAG: IPT/TIG domain-containing protein [Catenulispora sp.]
MSITGTSRPATKPPPTRAVLMWPLVAVVTSAILLVVLLSAVLVVLSDVYRWLAAKNLIPAEFALPMLLLAGVILFFAAIMALVNVYRSIRLQDKAHALGLPEGSVRAIIALVLIFLFFVATTFIFSNLMQAGPERALNGVTPAQFAQIPVTDIVSSTPVPATGTPTSYNIVVRGSAPSPAQDVGKNLVVLLGTLVTAVASFYFGSKSATSAAAAGARMHDSGVAAATVARPPDRPQVTGVSPGTGSESGGMSVTLDGVGLAEATSVTFGPNPATDVTLTSDTRITAVAPPGSGTVDVTVTTPKGASTPTLATKFTYMTPPGPVPQISGVNVESGPEDGDTPVILYGAGFTGATVVKFGAAEATPTAVSDRQISVRTPAGTGTVPITVTTPAGTSAEHEAARFTYLPEAHE